jgi:ligand-binding sensor domain-containing protein
LKIKHFIILIVIVSPFLRVKAQYPHYFTYDDENGLPSNEVYSIIQDNRGFIWIGCDAGLFKFDGIRYIPYKCATQNSKSITGLTISSSGKLYCFNFYSQLFYIENDTLKELKTNIPNEITITNLTADDKGKIIVSHSGGISSYDESDKKWKRYWDFNPKQMFLDNVFFAKIARVTSKGEIYFVKSNGVGVIKDEKMQFNEVKLFTDLAPGRFQLEYYKNKLWIFSLENNQMYSYVNGKISVIENRKLSNILENKKITNIKSLPDGKLWICTYKGIISYDSSNDVVQLFYPELSFSDCIFDREGNYWFSTLQTGLLRVSNLDFLVWDKSNDLIKNDKITKITACDEFIYFATINGSIGQLNRKNHQLNILHTGNSGDVQSLDFDPVKKRLWFYLNKLYYLQNGKITESEQINRPIKARKEINGYSFMATSHGVFVNDEKINGSWSREIEHDSINNHVWVATNKGLLKYEYNHSKWKLGKRFLDSIQIVSIDFDEKKQQLFALSFDGKIYRISANDDKQYISGVSDKIQSYKIKYHDSKLYVATNKGLWIYDLISQKWISFTKYNGLASDNVQQFSIVGNDIWLATGKGVQKIPIIQRVEKNPAKIYLSKVKVGNRIVKKSTSLQLEYEQSLFLYPETNSYSSNGNFQYIYRFKGIDTSWIKLPGSIELIEIKNIPSGNFGIELKAIDYNGISSENVIVLSGLSRPPYWKSWWFVTIVFFLLGVSIFIVVKKIIENIRRQEKGRTQLVHSQLTALKAQMNPHFMYNTLNSIQALIFKQDIKSSNLYLSKFSHLMRKVLDVSGAEEITLVEETEILELYLSLEKLRFGREFVYQLTIDPKVDTYLTYLPPLILQPFVENAIKHGLLHKKGEKLLEVSMKKEGEYLICKIKDNGIGRVYSGEIKKRQTEKHRSFSTDATQKRLDLLNRINHKKIELIITDLYNDEQQPAGTEVVLKIG